MIRADIRFLLRWKYVFEDISEKTRFLLPPLKGKANLSVGNVPYLTALSSLCRISLLLSKNPAFWIPWQSGFQNLQSLCICIIVYKHVMWWHLDLIYGEPVWLLCGTCEITIAIGLIRSSELELGDTNIDTGELQEILFVLTIFWLRRCWNANVLS